MRFPSLILFRSAIWLLLLLSQGDILYSQQLPYTIYTSQSGLPGNQVLKVSQDRDGFLWIATQNGLCLYDGKKMTVFNRWNGFPNLFIDNIANTSDGHIWVSGNREATLFRNGRIVQHLFTDSNYSISAYYAAGGNELLVTQFGLRRFQHGYSYPLYPAGAGKMNYLGIMPLGNRFVLYTTDYAFVLDENYRQIFTLKTDGALIKDSASRIWLLGDHCIRELDTAALMKGKLLPKPEKWWMGKIALFGPRYLYYDSRHAIWIATAQHGVCRVDSSGAIQWMNVSNGFISNTANHIMEDREGSIWISTNGGLCKIPEGYSSLITTSEGLASSFTTALTEDSAAGAIWVGNFYGISCIKGNKCYNFPVPHSSEFGISDLLLSGRTLWVASFNTLYKYSLQYSGAVSALQVKRIALPRHIRYITKLFDIEGHLLIGTSGGLAFLKGDSLSLLIDSLHVRSCMKHGNELWIGEMISGIYRYKINNKRYPYALTPYRHDSAVASSQVRCCIKAADSSLWFGSRYEGLFELVPDRKDGFTSFNYNTRDGLSSDAIYALYMDGRNRLYIGTFNGINILHRSGAQFYFENVAGTYNSGNVVHKIIQSVNGEILAATDAGLLRIRPHDPVPRRPTPVFLTHIASMGDTAIIPEGRGELHFPWKKNSLEFEFASPGFRNENATLYSYRLNGSDNTWSAPQKNNIVAYRALSPGQYSFEVKALNSDNLWSGITHFDFIIDAPFWQTWLFRLSSTLVLGGLLGVFFIWRIRTVKNRERTRSLLQKQVAEAETKALRAQMNPHFIFNCMNTIDSYILNNEAEKASDYLNSFSKFIRNILNNSNHPLISLSEELENTRLYLELEKGRFEKDFSFIIHAPRETLEGGFQVPPLLLQPFVENALQHGLRHLQGQERKITINVIARNNMLSLSISDNGIGRVKAGSLNARIRGKHQSMGTSLSSNRLNVMNALYNLGGTVKVTDLEQEGESTGTLVEILFSNPKRYDKSSVDR